MVHAAIAAGGAHEYKPLILYMYNDLRDLELRSNAKGRTLLLGNPDTLQDALEIPLDSHQPVISCGERCRACLKVQCPLVQRAGCSQNYVGVQ